MIFENSECGYLDCPINEACAKHWKVNYLSVMLLDQTIDFKCTGELNNTLDYGYRLFHPCLIFKRTQNYYFYLRYDFLSSFSLCKPKMFAE